MPVERCDPEPFRPPGSSSPLKEASSGAAAAADASAVVARDAKGRLSPKVPSASDDAGSTPVSAAASGRVCGAYSDDLGADAAAAPGAAPGAAARQRKLPAKEFSYIGRPAETFEGRWEAICGELTGRFGDEAFTLVDVGSCNGYFSLSTACRFPASYVVGIEGSVGVGNGQVGAISRNPAHLVVTEGVQKHVAWVNELGLENCVVAPEVWDLDRIETMAEFGFRVHALLLLSVVHHIDGICWDLYRKRGLSLVDGSLALIGALLRLADVHVLELPDRGWLDHLHDLFESPEAIIREAVRRSGEEFTMRLTYQNQWLGRRELWCIEAARPRSRASRSDLREAFAVLLPEDSMAMAVASLGSVVRPAVDSHPTGDKDFVDKTLVGRWLNTYGIMIEISGAPPTLECRYLVKNEHGELRTGELRSIAWDGLYWYLENVAGRFFLQAASATQLMWRACRGELAGEFTTEWNRVRRGADGA